MRTKKASRPTTVVAAPAALSPIEEIIANWDKEKVLAALKEIAAEDLGDDGVTWEEFKAGLESNRLGERKLFRD